MKFFVDEDGNKYEIDRETGEKTLLRSAESAPGVGDETQQNETESED